MFLIAVSLAAVAQSPNAAFNDGIDRTDPNFVTASLLVMSPGDELYSCAGHSCIRLECPKFNLDYCFSYESESVKDKIFTFFMGKLKMGMFALPVAEYLKTAKEEVRGVMQYRLNLPPDVKQRLWKILDERAAQGANLPYDYVKRGCGRSVRVVLQEALHPLQMEMPFMPDMYSKTRRELWDAAVSHHPWNRFFLHSFCGTEHDWNVSDIEKVVVPNDLLQFLKLAKVNGKPIIDSDGVELLPVNPKAGGARSCATGIFTPFVVTCVVAALSATNWFVKVKWLDLLFLALQSLAGVFFTYLVAFSNLPATDWNWLIVPFNLLPLVFWKWRQKWALWFAGVLVLWEIWMVAAPHRLTDLAYLVLVFAYLIFYLKFTCFGRVALLRDRIGRVTRPA
ncbi:MAG: DUF4105 domain-containing protein [Kiritimatiellae bacterium]|nr:DUF4105 domain-containing protein [Kiritimatiellia bacterium]